MTIEQEIAASINSKNLYGHAFNLTRSDERARDLLQDVALSALRHKNKFKGGNLPAWLNTILRHTFINNLRKEQVIQQHKKVYKPQTFSDPIYTCDSSDIYKMISKLPKRVQTAILLTSEGFKIREISDITGVAGNTIKTRQAIARRDLKKVI